MAKLKSERHHWWPECVSELWKDTGGGVHWLLPDGEVRRSRPSNFGVIGNGHHIKLSRNPAEATVWDECFEREFQRADDNFPRVIRWLDGLERAARPGAPRKTRFLPQSAPDKEISLLIEGLVSLAVRSPMTREAAVALAEDLRGPLPERERNVLIGANMRHAQRRAMQAIGIRGKIAVIYSPDREFIFGDGFFHNLTSPAAPPINPTILAPLTPTISVLFAIPMQYTTEPRIATLVIDAHEAALLNDTVQVYARRALFYRSESPQITEAYRQERHLQYSSLDHPVENMIRSMPGVPPRDRSLDFLSAMASRR